MIPLWAIQAAIGAALVAGAGAYGYHHGVQKERGKWERQAAETLAQVQTESARRTARLQENVDAAYLKQRQAESDARSLRAAAVGLRDQVTAYARASCPAAAPGGPAATDPGLLLADVLSSAAERAEQLAGAADSARIAGQLCQSAYEGLSSAAK